MKRIRDSIDKNKNQLEKEAFSAGIEKTDLIKSFCHIHHFSFYKPRNALQMPTRIYIL